MRLNKKKLAHFIDLKKYVITYGVRGNSRSLWSFYAQLNKIVLKWLNRRSHRRSYTWKQYHALVRHFGIPRPRIMEGYIQMELSHA